MLTTSIGANCFVIDFSQGRAIFNLVKNGNEAVSDSRRVCLMDSTVV